MMNPIEVTELTHRYRHHDAVRDLSFVVPPGSVCALLGPNGAGKTTTLKVLAGLLRQTRGKARISGVDTHALTPAHRTRFGFVGEDQELPSWMTVTQLLSFCRPLYPDWDGGLERRLMSRFELPPARRLRHLSRGMRLKAAFVATLAFRPGILVLDEPFSGLDPITREDIVAGLLEAVELGGSTVLVSSHDIEEVERLCDRLVVIDGGRRQLEENTESLLQRTRAVEVRGRRENGPASPDAAWLNWQADESGVRFVETHYVPGESEQAYAARFPGAAIEVRTLALRDVFIAMGRARTWPAKEECK